MNEKQRNITLQDVAAYARVSAITVSRAIRTPEQVSEKSRTKITEAIETLGYVPDPAASALASRKSPIICVAIPSVSNNVFSAVLSGIYDASDGGRLAIQVGNYRYSPIREENVLRQFLSQRPSGLVVTGVDQSEQSRQLLEQVDCPVVQIMDLDDKPVQHIIGFSSYDAGQQVAEHLVEMGYKRPGFIGGRMDPRMQRRLAGFTDTLEKMGLYDPNRIKANIQPSSVGLGAQLFTDLIATEPETDAVFCANDDLAAGVIFEAQRRHINVPHQLGVCGFSDLDICQHINPSLTTVATPRYAIGRKAIEIIQNAVSSPKDRAVHKIDFGFELKKRRSTARQQ